MEIKWWSLVLFPSFFAAVDTEDFECNLRIIRSGPASDFTLVDKCKFLPWFLNLSAVKQQLI